MTDSLKRRHIVATLLAVVLGIAVYNSFTADEKIATSIIKGIDDEWVQLNLSDPAPEKSNNTSFLRNVKDDPGDRISVTPQPSMQVSAAPVESKENVQVSVAQVESKESVQVSVAPVASKDRPEASNASAEVINGSTPTVVCSPDGFIIDMAKQYRKFHNDDLPKLRDAFADDGYLYGIVNIRMVRGGSNTMWIYNAAWKCLFDINGEIIPVDSTAEGRDGHGHTHVVKCKMPSAQLMAVSIVGVSRSDALRVEFKDVPFCALPRAPVEPELVMMCTMIVAVSLSGRQLDYWRAWHTRLGVTKTVLYANENPTKLREMANTTAYPDRIEVADFGYDQGGIFQSMDQQSIQTSCIYRNRRRFRWVFLNDVDEYFFPAQADSFEQFLGQLPPDYRNAPGLLMCNKWHRTTDGPDGARYRVTRDPRLVNISSNMCTSRGKYFVQPERIQYFSVHHITSGQHGFQVPSQLGYLTHIGWQAQADEVAVPNPAFANKARLIFAGMDPWDFLNGTEIRRENGFR